MKEQKRGHRLSVDAILRVTLIIALCVGVWLPVASGGPTPIEITGTVKRAQVDARGVVLRVYVEAEDGTEHLVLDNVKGKELIGQVYSTVQVKAIPRKPKTADGFTHLIEVVSFVVLQTNPGPAKPRPPSTP